MTTERQQRLLNEIEEPLKRENLPYIILIQDKDCVLTSNIGDQAAIITILRDMIDNVAMTVIKEQGKLLEDKPR